MNTHLTGPLALVSFFFGLASPSGRGALPDDPPDCGKCSATVSVTAGNPCAVAFVPVTDSEAICIYSAADYACLPSGTCYSRIQAVFNIGLGRSVQETGAGCTNPDAQGKVTITIETNPGGPPGGPGCGTFSQRTFTVCANPCGGGCAPLCATVIRLECSECLGVSNPI